MDDHELIGRYLAGRLTEEEELMVQARVVADAAFRNEVEVTRGLKTGMRELEHRGEVLPLLAARDENRTTKLAMAAGIAAVAVGLIAFYFYQEREAAGPALVRETLRFELTRGGPEADVTWARGSAPVALELHFDVGPEPAPSYQVSIWRLPDGSDRPALTRSIVAQADGEVMLGMDGSLLPPGDYEIRLEPRPAAATAVVVSYTLAVRAEP